MDEPIDMPFWMLSYVVLENHVLDGGRIPHAKGNFNKRRPIVKCGDSLP